LDGGRAAHSRRFAWVLLTSPRRCSTNPFRDDAAETYLAELCSARYCGPAMGITHSCMANAHANGRLTPAINTSSPQIRGAAAARMPEVPAHRHLADMIVRSPLAIPTSSPEPGAAATCRS